ncbi:hypothetical protein [Paracoccus sp. (in: a-proteobacteria)]|uniref:hypothetical protein n=1 Tax=Paracoccus sp. TaxID=267 RepID=UPI0026DF6342|nr:hypothetical protein [Paracoccus sp. (in: a-proteobacteria)]
MITLADRARQGDPGGRGNVSFAALKSDTRWFLRVGIDQVTFMDGMQDVRSMAERFDRYTAHAALLRS